MADAPHDLTEIFDDLRDKARARPWPETWRALLGAGVNACARLDAASGDLVRARTIEHLSAWPAPYEAPPCPCRDWSRWLAHAPAANTSPTASPTASPEDTLKRWLAGAQKHLESYRPPQPFFGCPPLACLIASQPEPEYHFLYCSQTLSERPGGGLCVTPVRATAALYTIARDPARRAMVVHARQTDAEPPPTEVLRDGDRVVLGGYSLDYVARFLRLEHPEDGVSYHPLHLDDFTIGRLPANHITVQRASLANRHIRFVRTQQGLTAIDLGSTSGTFINGRKVLDSHPVQVGDTVHVGALTIALHQPCRGTA